MHGIEIPEIPPQKLISIKTIKKLKLAYKYKKNFPQW